MSWGGGSNLIWARPKTQHIPLQNHNTPRLDLPPPRPSKTPRPEPQAEGMLSKLSSHLQRSDAGVVSRHQQRGNVSVYHQPRWGEAGDKPVYTLEAVGMGLAWMWLKALAKGLHLVKVPRQRFPGHLAALWTVLNLGLTLNSWGFSLWAASNVTKPWGKAHKHIWSSIRSKVSFSVCPPQVWETQSVGHVGAIAAPAMLCSAILTRRWEDV